MRIAYGPAGAGRNAEQQICETVFRITAIEGERTVRSALNIDVEHHRPVFAADLYLVIAARDRHLVVEVPGIVETVLSTEAGYHSRIAVHRYSRPAEVPTVLVGI